MSDSLMETEGVKNDSDKEHPMGLIHPVLLTETAAVLRYGAAKYEAHNHYKGMAWSRPFGALMRHMWAWWGGEDHDPETGLSHLAHAACNLMFLMEYRADRRGTDDRWVQRPEGPHDAADIGDAWGGKHIK
ncbi:MAG: dATP/dGTP diphosphohydrolase domain-containing protein [Paracoccaceae bacterium]